MKRFIKKICMCGDPAVGKTSLTRRFISGSYSPKYITTLGTVISKKIIQFPAKDVTMDLQIWDISGQAEFKRIHASAFKYSEAAFVVCDILRPETAESVSTWVENLQQYSRHDIPVVILVNKYDLIERKRKNMDEVKKTLGNLNLPIFRTSAKTGHNVEHCFDVLGERLIPVETKLPRSAEEMVSMPEIFENPYDFLDFVITRYSNSFGDTEMSMHLIRRQVESSGKNFTDIPEKEAMKIIEKLSEIIVNFKGKEDGQILRDELMEAYKRCNWEN